MRLRSFLESSCGKPLSSDQNSYHGFFRLNSILIYFHKFKRKLLTLWFVFWRFRVQILAQKAAILTKVILVLREGGHGNHLHTPLKYVETPRLRSTFSQLRPPLGPSLPPPPPHLLTSSQARGPVNGRTQSYLSLYSAMDRPLSTTDPLPHLSSPIPHWSAQFTRTSI
jgi:hypothetical protein